jgi:diguanylate cyclase (GGDEF)-like protein
MISLKKYLDSASTGLVMDGEPDEGTLLPVTIAAYRSALIQMGNCSQDACPALGDELKRGLEKLEESLSTEISCKAIEATEEGVQQELRDWGMRTARHYRQKAGEVKDLLIVMARTAESVGERDQRCAGQFDEVTSRLRGIASLEDLSQIRASIERSAADLKNSIDRMTEEGKAAIKELRAEVSNYQVRLEEAEHIASRDALTGLGSRLWVEGQIEHRIESGAKLCVGIIDIDAFKRVNDEHGHLVGDELLKQFAAELKSACRSTDLIGRWGGDEFIILLDCEMTKARGKIDRLREWICGSYSVHGRSGATKLKVQASIGVAEYMPGEAMKELIDRADAAMYEHKVASRADGAGQTR